MTNWSADFNETLNSLLRIEPPKEIQECVRPIDKRPHEFRFIPVSVEKFLRAYCFNNKADPSYYMVCDIETLI